MKGLPFGSFCGMTRLHNHAIQIRTVFQNSFTVMTKFDQKYPSLNGISVSYIRSSMMFLPGQVCLGHVTEAVLIQLLYLDTMTAVLSLVLHHSGAV